MTHSKESSAAPVRVIHVNDCAFYAQRLIDESHRLGLRWELYPRARTESGVRGYFGKLKYVARGGRWLLGLAWRALRADVMHVHSAGVYRHTRFLPRRYMLTLHGTDIREQLYDPKYRKTILAALRRADAVMYTTPDLAEHVRPHRPDAVYVPMPVETGRTKAADSVSSGPVKTIFFASRWERAKGVEDQLECVRRLHEESRGNIRLIGLDWGDRAAEAAGAGVELLPRLTHEDYLTQLRSSDVVVGQFTGLLGASELEAMAGGTPLYMPLRRDLYPDAPVGGTWGSDSPANVAHAALNDLGDPDKLAARSTAGQQWIRANHDPARIFRDVVRVYRGGH